MAIKYDAHCWHITISKTQITHKITYGNISAIYCDFSDIFDIRWQDMTHNFEYMGYYIIRSYGFADLNLPMLHDS